MACHYCHSCEHNINDCPNIICRYCNEVGHPKWLCKNKNKKNDKNNKSKKNNEKDIMLYNYIIENNNIYLDNIEYVFT